MSLPVTLGAVVGLVGAAAAEDVIKGRVEDGGVVACADLGCRNVVALTDGTWLTPNGRHSTDGGLTWSPPDLFTAEGHELKRASSTSLLRLADGRLALVYRGITDGNGRGACLWISDDEGRTWGAPRPIALKGGPYHDTMIQISTGRLIYPTRLIFGNGSHPDLERRGHHTHMPELTLGWIGYSDDLGRTWHGCRDYLMGWFDQAGEPNGEGGVTNCDEPSVAEIPDGRLLFFARSTVGRIVYSHSDDGGRLWTAVRPTGLASSFSPCRLRRIPGTDDLLCVWNQVSVAEIERGDWRARLSAAISSDGGATWHHFRTLLADERMDPVTRIEPERPIRHRRVGIRRGGRAKATYFYPNVCFLGDKVFLTCKHERRTRDAEGRKRRHRAQLVRIYPMSWFYGP